MEGKVYLSSWQRSGKRFKAWLTENPECSVSADSFDAAKEALWDLICLKFGDGEAVLEFDALPAENDFLTKYGMPEILSISGNDNADPIRPPQEGLFEMGRCPLCKRHWGARSKIIAEFGFLPTESDGAVTAEGKFFSSDFLELLTDTEKENLAFQPVKALNATKKTFFELVGKPVAQYVGLAGFAGKAGETCSHCGFQSFPFLVKNKIHEFLAKKDIDPSLTCFVVTNGRSLDFCMTGERWRQLRGKRGTKNLVSSRIYIVPESEVIRNNVPI
jgi:hypothetical protein